jgi:hypothetical protein
MNFFVARDCQFRVECGKMASSFELHKLLEEKHLSHHPDVLFAGSIIEVRSKAFTVLVEPCSGLEGSLIRPRSEPEWRLENSPSTLTPEFRSLFLGNLRVCDASVWTGAYESLKLKMLPSLNDWTFTSTYWGCIRLVEPCEVREQFSSDCTDAFLPTDLIKNEQHSLLFYKEVPFWDDELGDNGSSRMNAKIRIMDSFFYILVRIELSIRSVTNRSIETRIFHEFGSDKILREFRWVEEGRERVNLKVQQTLLFDNLAYSHS